MLNFQLNFRVAKTFRLPIEIAIEKHCQKNISGTDFDSDSDFDLY